MRLDLTTVHKALASLGRAIGRSKDAPQDEELRDAVIQEYRRQRNITAHTYDEATAKSVYETALKFLPDAQALVETIGRRNRA